MTLTMGANKKIVIYGAGDYGRRFLGFLRKQGVEPDFFCQTQVKDTSTCIEGIPLISINELCLMKALVYIAIADKTINSQIRCMLSDLIEIERKELDVYDCSDFIRANLEMAEKKCLICAKSVTEFKAFGNEFKFFDDKHVIGGGHRENCVCPNCGALDRTRWCFRNLRKYTDIFSKQCRVLHIAPEEALRARICNNMLCDYYAGDLYPDGTMNKVDVTNIQFVDNFFDYIIMNHVLEHIKDEEIAISELKRVLKPDGILILSFPICIDGQTEEEVCELTEQERIERFGQRDHVRLYGYDFQKRLEQYGLKIVSYIPNNEVTEREINRLGFIQDDICLFCSK